jgi:hypothetical protein
VGRHSVAELWGATQHQAAAVHQPGALVRVPTGQLAVVPEAEALATFVDRLPIPPSAMIAGGLGLAALGALFATFVSTGFIGAVLFGGMLTFGGGVAFLGVRKRRGPPDNTPQAPTVDPHVLAERGRRVHAVLARGGSATFERLLAQLRWTERALVETLIAMKDSGAIIEDLDLDSGEWVYRVQGASELGDNMGTAASLTLDQRQGH